MSLRLSTLAIVCLLLLGCSVSSDSQHQQAQAALQSTPAAAPLTLATETPTAVPLALATGFVLNSVLPDLMPDSTSIPDGLTLSAEDSLSNQEVAKDYQNPAEFLKKLDDWGRTISYFHEYSNVAGCDITSGIQSLSISIIHYTKMSGASASLKESKWYGKSPERSDKPGDEAAKDEYDIASNCNQSTPLRGVTLAFRRWNILATINVISVKGTMTDAEMFSVATKLAEIIDTRIVNAVR